MTRTPYVLFFTVFVKILTFGRSSEIILNSNVSDIPLSDELDFLDMENAQILEQILELDENRGLSESYANRSSQNKTVMPINETIVPDSWDVIESVLNSTNTTTPYPPFNKSSTGGCVLLASDVEIIFGKYKDEFQNSVAKCSRKSLGSYKNTMRCLAQLSFDGKYISTQCSDCWAKTAHCGVKHCAHQCLFSTCVAKCQKCSTRACSSALNECAGTTWMPMPCGLDPHSPIPDRFKVQDPK
ncbi:hypothetical protein FG386_003293 [Cryptosporidium ryanae]|uniref:uncharacterized protein n=1 Tax=Cryptosporidium ryanae TaxID=515981 RepID=UPI00351A8030|nr:hypothetical protein FG386_003293 [Cryptosporidium ryanae]